MQQEINGKFLICNGSINATLTIDELLQFNEDNKRTALRYFQIEGQYRQINSEIDSSVFKPMQELYTYETLMQLSGSELDLALTKVYNNLQQHEAQLQVATNRLHYDLGKKIHAATIDLKFSGELKLTKGQLLGFIDAIGNWNDFRANKVAKAINYLHASAPRVNYGNNNPNTGRLWHEWCIAGDSIYMKFGLCNSEALATIKNWFNTITNVKSMAGADSFELHVQEIQNEYSKDQCYIVTVELWWD